jgi:elongation factor G
MKAIIWDDDQSLMGAEFEITDIPANLADKAAEYREALLEAIVSTDDDLAERYLEGEELSADELRVALRKATISNEIVPMLCGTAFKNKGVQPLLDAVSYYMPSPLDVPPCHGMDSEGKEVVRQADEGEELSALAFKLFTDPHNVKMVFVRVYSGILKSGTYVYNSTKDKKERVGRLLKMHANKTENVDELGTGEIGAVVGLSHTITGDTIVEEGDDLILEAMNFPEPVVSMKVNPKDRADRDKLTKGLLKLGEEDPTFRVSSDEETEETIISGMGELHLDIIVDRLRRENKVEVETGAPQVAYRETITQEVDHTETYKKQSGGKGQFAKIQFRVERGEPGSGYEFVNEVKGGNIPKEFIGPIDKGFQDTMPKGPMAGFPVVDLKFTVYDGSFHAVDSSEQAFKTCASMGFKAAFMKGKPQLLEPIMKVVVTTPEEFSGAISGDYSSKRGQVTAIEDQGNAKLVKGLVPLSSMFGYITDLRSATSGRASYVMEFSHYDPVPNNIAEEVIAERKAFLASR